MPILCGELDKGVHRERWTRRCPERCRVGAGALPVRDAGYPRRSRYPLQYVLMAPCSSATLA
jgi:hypothetical protein